MTYAERAQKSLLLPLATRTLETAQTVVGRLPRLRQRQEPLAVGIPPVEYNIYDPTYERFARSETQLWRNLDTKARLLAAGDDAHKEYTTALLVGGGAFAGVVTAGMLEVFRERGVIDVFDAIIGVSAGAANGACVLGSKSDAGIRTYTDVLAAKNGLLKHGTWRPGGLDLAFLRDYFLSDAGLDTDKITAARPRLHIGVVDDQGNRVLHDISQLAREEMIDRVLISCAAPYMTTDVFSVNGVQLTDGYINGFPLEEVMRDYDNIVVMSNFPVDHLFGERDFNRAEQFWLRRNTRRYSEAVRNILLQGGGVVAQSLAPLLDNTDKNISLLVPAEKHVSVTTRNRHALFRGGYEGRRAATEKLDAHEFELVGT